MSEKKTDDLHKKYCIAKNALFRSDAPFGKIPDSVIRPGDGLYSLRLESSGAYGMGVQAIEKTLCTRCGRIGGQNASAFGIMVTKIDRVGNECDDCGVSLDALDALLRAV